MKRMGYSDVTIWGEQIKRLGYFRKYYRSTGRSIYNPDVTDEYIQLQKKRYEAGEIGYETFKIKQFTGRPAIKSQEEKAEKVKRNAKQSEYNNRPQIWLRLG